MFADELKSNASRKRAEANRAKRRQLKQQQDAKRMASVSSTSSAAAAASSAVATPHAVPTSPTAAAAATAAFPPPQSTSTAPSLTPMLNPQPPSTTSLSAVEKAKVLREHRALEAKRLAAAQTLQSIFRCWRSNQNLRTAYMQTLRSQLSDIESLSKILKAKKGLDMFVPPAATTTTMLQSFLWLVQTIPYPGRAEKHIRSFSKDLVELLQGLIECCIWPSLVSSTTATNPFVNWASTKEGARRWKLLLRYMTCALLDHQTPLPTVQGIVRCLEQVLLVGVVQAPTTLTTLTQQILLAPDSPPAVPPTRPQSTRTSTTTTSTTTPFHYSTTTLDTLCVIRYYLMFGSGNNTPIPPTANERREGSISDHNRTRGGILLRYMWNVVQSHPSTQMLRAFCMIWTVPLLSWKLSNDALTLLVESKNATSQVSRIQGSTTTRTSIATDFGATVCPMQTMLYAFLHSYTQSSTSPGSLDTFLATPDVTLTTCPATPTQCVLANLAQLGRLCPLVNGNHVSTTDFDFAAVYYNVLSALLDVVPLMTFHSRESAVEWISDGKGHHSPVVLSEVILDQCRIVTMDSFIRRIFACAVDMEYFHIDTILSTKTSEDVILEKEMTEAGTTSNTALAAKEARIDRNKPFWSSSKWAKRLTKNVSNLLSGGGDNASGGNDARNDRGRTKDSLVDQSNVSAKLARGDKVQPVLSPFSETPRRVDNFQPTLFFAVCRMFAVIIARWGGNGGRDITAGNRPETLKSVAIAQTESVTMSILNALSFSTPVLRVTWGVLQGDPRIKQALDRLVSGGRGGAPLMACHCVGPLSESMQQSTLGEHDALGLLLVFVSCLSHTLIVTDDVEIHDLGKPLPLHQLRRVILVLKKLVYKVCTSDTTRLVPCHVGCATVGVSAKAMSDLYNRSSRRPLCLPKVWLIPDLLEKELRSCKTYEDYLDLLAGPILRVCPQLVSFKRRLKLFERIVYTNRASIQGENSPNPFHSNPLKPARVAVIHRGRILEDGLATMNNLGANMRQRISVHYVSETGHKETGVDAGGLFKDFWTDLCAIAFDPNYALFAVTEGAGNSLFPSPLSRAAHGTDHLMLFAFLGRILGKALYEGITVHPLFAHFFLAFMKGRYNYLNMLADLSTIDPDLYKNLIFLKTYEGDAADLCLTFTVASNDFGGNKEIPLIPRGDTIDVTNANKTRYIELVAKYYVVDRVREQSEAFTRGLWEVIDPMWLRLFNEPELQVLISGPTGEKIDIEDLKRHTRYVGGYSGLDRTVSRFWKVVESLDSSHQAKLLRFVTSCERPPPLGFSSLNPPFTIQRVGILRDSEKLPSSSTCFNILKLPTYSSEQVLRKKLLYALDSGSGFELT